MSIDDRIARLPRKEQRGSRLRCILFTEGDPTVVAGRFNHIVDSLATVDPARHSWMPKGFDLPAEAELGKSCGLIPDSLSETIRNWWLIHAVDASLPSWDLISQATIERREGLILVEAKAHDRELDEGGKHPGGDANRESIAKAIGEANQALNLLSPGWALSIDSHYQLVNRFAWAWKLASLGVPVILVYLGFIGATEMRDRGKPIQDKQDWRALMDRYCDGTVPREIWKQRLVINGTPFRAVLSSMAYQIPDHRP